MTTAEPAERRTEAINLRLTPSEVAPLKACVRKDRNLSDVVRGLINDERRPTVDLRRARFESQLASGELVERGRFRNEAGEEWVVYTLPAEHYMHDVAFVTGDEVDWDNDLMLEGGYLARQILLSKTERAQVEHILGRGQGENSEAYETGRAYAVKIGTPEAVSLAKHPNSPRYRQAMQTMMWMGGMKCSESGYGENSGYPGDTQTFEFFKGFMAGLHEVDAAHEKDGKA